MHEHCERGGHESDRHDLLKDAMIRLGERHTEIGAPLKEEG